MDCMSLAKRTAECLPSESVRSRRTAPSALALGLAHWSYISSATSGRRISSLIFGLLLSSGIFCMTADRSWAHAHLLQATPTEGSVVHGNPVEVTLRFSQDLEPALSGASIVEERGARKEIGRAIVDQKERRILHIAPTTDLSGTYRVIWHAVSIDSHETKGQYTFTVAP